MCLVVPKERGGVCECDYDRGNSDLSPKAPVVLKDYSKKLDINTAHLPLQYITKNIHGEISTLNLRDV